MYKKYEWRMKWPTTIKINPKHYSFSLYCGRHLRVIRMVTIHRVAKSCLYKLMANFGVMGFDVSKV